MVAPAGMNPPVINSSTGSLSQGYPCMRLLCWLGGQLEAEVSGHVMPRLIKQSGLCRHYTAFADGRQGAQGPRTLLCGGGDCWFSAVELRFFVPGAYVVELVLIGEATDHCGNHHMGYRNGVGFWSGGEVKRRYLPCGG
jgi:hypothetical protein